MSNLYANKVFSEHPIALWSFDEDAHYKSLVSETDRELNLWPTKTNLTSSEYTGSNVGETPFLNSYVTQAYPTVNTTTDCVFTSNNLWDSLLVYPNVPVSSSIYIFIPADVVNYIDYGSTDGTSVEYTRHLTLKGQNRYWMKLTHNDLQYRKIYIKINFDSGSSQEDTTWLFNGLTLGQYSEQTSSDSLGVETSTVSGLEDAVVYTTLPDTISWYETESIGSKEKILYYIEEDARLLAYNTAMPMVYGSNYLTRILPSSEGFPSIVFDGNGFLSNAGKYDTYTFEFWMKITGFAETPIKIFGNAGFTSGVTESNDGLWITSSILTLVIGNKQVLSYNVGDFSDPMLIHIVYTTSEISLMINGEMVASQKIDNINNLVFANNESKWLGFWGSENFDVFEIDCMSLFGYVVPELVARKRFVWGQGVNDINVINSQYQGVGAIADFASSKINSNVAYPLNFFWDSGVSDNLEIKNNKLTTPSLSLPTTVLGLGTKEEWLDSINTNFPSEECFSYVPSVSYSGITSYTLFNSLGDFVSNPVGLVVNWENTSLDNEPVFVLTNQFNNSKKIIVSISGGDTITTSYVESEVATVIAEEEFDNTKKQSTFINFSGYLKENDENIPDGMRQLLLNSNQLKLIVGYDENVTNTGKYFSVGIISKNNYTLEIKDLLPSINDASVNIERTVDDQYSCFDLCSYSWIPKRLFGVFYEDIGIKGYWQDYISASQLAGIVKDYSGKEKLSLNNIQFNIGHVRPNSLIQSESGAWTYQEMEDFYDGTALGLLYSGFFTGYVTYDDLSTRTIDTLNPDISLPLDSSNMFVRSFISFQKNNTSIKQRNELLGHLPPTSGNVIYAQAYDNYLNTEFEVINGTTIIPPINIYPDNLLIAIYLEFSVPGIFTYPVALKSLEVSSFTSNQNTFTAIKTRGGKDIYPVVNNGTYYDYGSIHPFKIDKRGYPYLYLGRETGFISEADRFNEEWHKGFLLEIPEGKDQNYRLDNIQFWTRRNKIFPENEQKIFSFSYSIEEIYITMQRYQSDGSRGILKAYNKDGTPNNEISFYQNGNYVLNPILDMNQWSAINIAFAAGGLNLLTSMGYIKLYQGLVFNNISYFAARTYLGSSDVVYNKWTDIDDEDWEYWSSNTNADPNTWAKVLVYGKVATKTKELSQIVYKTYVGTQFINAESQKPLLLKQGEISSKNNIVWSSTSIIPV